MNILIVTGPAGSGKTAALHALEDIGYYAVDNLPLPLLPVFLDLLEKTGEASKAAIVVDARSGDLLKDAPEVFSQVRSAGHDLDILYLDSSDEVLLRRFSETRRRHPLAGDNLLDGIEAERLILQPLKEYTARIIDTSDLTPHELKRLVWDRYGANDRALTVTIESFGFRKGVPPEADLIFDVRFLPNPYFVEKLSSLPGTDRRVADYVLSSRESKLFLEKTLDLLDFLIPLYAKEGKSYLTIGIGCTGGRHRSVAIAGAIQNSLSEKGIGSTLRHRDLTIKTDRGGI